MEILIRVVDKNQPDPQLSIEASKAGDVIAVCPDGWAWTPEELTNPEWRIVRAPILAATAETLLTRPDQSDAFPNRRKPRRAWRLNFAAFPIASLFIGPRTAGIITLTRKNVTDVAVDKQWVP